MKKMLSLILTVLLMATFIPSIAAAEDGWTMYVYTENGGALNVRSAPQTGDNIIGQLQFGDSVWVYALSNDGWATIEWQSYYGEFFNAYVMSRYLVNEKPDTSKKEQEKKAEEQEKLKNLEELNRQLASARSVDQPFMISVRANRSSGWVNFRVGPGVAADRIASLPDGRQLKVIGETDKWYQAVDMETGKTGYISKSYVTVLSTPVQAETGSSSEKESLGRLNVNGEFTLQCKLPDGYTLQVVNMMGTKIVASVLSQDKEKPMLYLSIAFDELYSGVERMNDLTNDQLKALEETFSEMNEVAISYKETAYGTKLLIAKEVGDDTDFVDILSVYKGYFVEFIMTPNPEAQNQKLTSAQIQMCIDFLSEVDFVPAK